MGNKFCTSGCVLRGHDLSSLNGWTESHELSKQREWMLKSPYRQERASGDAFQIMDLSYKSHNAPVPYPTMHHSEQKCEHFCSEWRIVGHETGALWDLWDWSILSDRRTQIVLLQASLDIVVSRLIAHWMATQGGFFWRNIPVLNTCNRLHDAMTVFTSKPLYMKL